MSPTKVRAKISTVYDPAEWEGVEETLPDGSVRTVYVNGAVFVRPPYPAEPAWRDTVSKSLCKIAYEIQRKRKFQ